MNKAGQDFSQVAVFYLDQNNVFDRPAFIWTREQARAAKNKLGKFIHNGKAFQLFESTPLSRRNFSISDSNDAYTNISLAEMKANVGITDNPEGEPAIAWMVAAAQEKIAAIGSRAKGTYDELAPLAFGGWAGPSSIEVSVQP